MDDDLFTLITGPGKTSDPSEEIFYIWDTDLRKSRVWGFRQEARTVLRNRCRDGCRGLIREAKPEIVRYGLGDDSRFERYVIFSERENPCNLRRFRDDNDEVA